MTHKFKIREDVSNLANLGPSSVVYQITSTSSSEIVSGRNPLICFDESAHNCSMVHIKHFRTNPIIKTRWGKLARILLLEL